MASFSAVILGLALTASNNVGVVAFSHTSSKLLNGSLSTSTRRNRIRVSGQNDGSEGPITVNGAPFQQAYPKEQNTRVLLQEIGKQEQQQPTTNHIDPQKQTFPLAAGLTEIDVRYNLKSPLHYDPELERFLPFDDHDHPQHLNDDQLTLVQSTFLRRKRRKYPGRKLIKKVRQRFWPSLRSAFLPEGVSQNYYTFMKWRILQRYISANVHVLTTQSLLLGLGIKSAKGSSRAASLGVSAAVNWVLKDALGKISRMVWASKMGRKFDSDAKRWRFRSSLLFATGSGLEVVTYLYPQLFLLLATVANSLKQMSMLTSSATRNAIYNSFRMADVQQHVLQPTKKLEAPLRENIGDITAKGEAQIATVDLLGIASGVVLSKMIGVESMTRILLVYAALQICEMFCMYRLTRSVVFNTLNFERLYSMVELVVSQHSQTDIVLPTPSEAAKTEKIFLPPKHLARKAIAFGSIGRAKLSPEELDFLLTKIFKGDRFIIVVGQNIKHAHQNKGKTAEQKAREHCHVVLHRDATNLDILRSVLMLGFLRRDLAIWASEHPDQVVDFRSRDCYDLILHCKRRANQVFPHFLTSLEQAGWSTSRFMFGRVSMRVEWNIVDEKGIER